MVTTVMIIAAIAAVVAIGLEIWIHRNDNDLGV